MLTIFNGGGRIIPEYRSQHHHSVEKKIIVINNTSKATINNYKHTHTKGSSYSHIYIMAANLINKSSTIMHRKNKNNNDNGKMSTITSGKLTYQFIDEIHF